MDHRNRQVTHFSDMLHISPLAPVLDPCTTLSPESDLLHSPGACCHSSLTVEMPSPEVQVATLDLTPELSTRHLVSSMDEPVTPGKVCFTSKKPTDPESQSANEHERENEHESENEHVSENEHERENEPESENFMMFLLNQVELMHQDLVKMSNTCNAINEDLKDMT